MKRSSANTTSHLRDCNYASFTTMRPFCWYLLLGLFLYSRCTLLTPFLWNIHSSFGGYHNVSISSQLVLTRTDIPPKEPTKIMAVFTQGESRDHAFPANLRTILNRTSCTALEDRMSRFRSENHTLWQGSLRQDTYQTSVWFADDRNPVIGVNRTSHIVFIHSCFFLPR